MTRYLLNTATRNYRMDDAELNALIATRRAEIFATEDGPMLAPVQERMGDASFWSLNPRMLAIDAAPLAVRWQMDKLLAAQAAATAG